MAGAKKKSRRKERTIVWNQLSLVAGVSFWRFYYCFFRGAIRGRIVKKYVESLDGHIVLDRLPGYAPELNPVEYLFGYATQRELANLYLDTIDEVKRYATRRLKSMQRRPTLIEAF